MKPNIVLIGMPAVGKSTIGRLLAKKLHKHFLDTDSAIANKMHMPTYEVALKYGREFFRDIESEIIENIRRLRRQNFVISLGGGAVIRPANLELLGPSSLIIWLDAPNVDILARFEEYLARVGGAHRPKLLNPASRAEELASMRQYLGPKYELVANYKIMTQETPAQTVDFIVQEVSCDVIFSAST